MATLFMMMGLPGSGKTTLAHRLERERPALVLSPDVWMSRIVGDGYDFKRREAVTEVQLEVAERVLRLGSDVVLDFGFFHRSDRDEARARARAAGAQAQLVFLDPPIQELVRRVEARNAALPPDTFPVSREHVELCATWLERPQAD